MEAAILALVVIGVLLAIGSGVWVAVALVRAISTRPGAPAGNDRRKEESEN